MHTRFFRGVTTQRLGRIPSVPAVLIRVVPVVAILLGSLSGCAHWRPGLAGTPCPVAWVPSESLDATTLPLRARIELDVGREKVHLELVAQTEANELVVVGLARFGVRLFALRQRGSDVAIETVARPELEQVAIWVMDAIHRSIWIKPPEKSVAGNSTVDAESPAAGADSIRDRTRTRWNRAGEDVMDAPSGTGWRRIYSLPGAADSEDLAARRVAIDYLDSSHSLDSAGLDYSLHIEPRATTISVRNPWCGYEAIIVPL